MTNFASLVEIQRFWEDKNWDTNIKIHGVGANSTLAQAASHVPKAELQAIMEAGALAPIVAPQVKPAAE